MKTDELGIVYVFIKRWKLFLISLIVCLSIGSYWVYKQIQIIKTDQEQYKASALEKLDTKERIGFIKAYRYKQVAAPKFVIDQISTGFMQEDRINDFRLYASTPYYDIYVVFYEKPKALKDLIGVLRSHPATIEDQKMLALMMPHFEERDVQIYAESVLRKGFFEEMSPIPYIQSQNGKPINKHYVYLDKDRVSSREYEYAIRSTEVIKNHQSLNSKKIWVFMIVCSIMISIFIIFSVEGFVNMRAQYKKRFSRNQL